MMSEPASTPPSSPALQSFWAKFAFVTLGLLWAAAGWFVLLQGGFHKTYKYSKQTTYVDGPGAICMAYVFLILANVAIAIVIQSAAPKRTVILYLLSAALLAPPCIFLLQR